MDSLILTVHLLGLALGFGTVAVNDGLFLQALFQPSIGPHYQALTRRFSTLIWIGVTLLIVSGLAWFVQDPGGYLEQSKFVAKMVIVGVLLVNAVVLNTYLQPRLDAMTPRDWLERSQRLHALVAVGLPFGVVSGVSWMGALILGASHRLPVSTGLILLVYGFTLLVAYWASLGLVSWLLAKKSRR